ncbi:MAG: Polyphenol oxidase [Legionellaceae bacterium]
MNQSHKLIHPNWLSPKNVHAFTTTRYYGGTSQGSYENMNLGLHVHDNPINVIANREILRNLLPNEPCWLEQVHGKNIVIAQKYDTLPVADASYTLIPNQVCIIQTADCLPILISNQQGTQVAAIHGGWRSLVQGIIAETISKFNQPKEELVVWLGPAIGTSAFEIGMEVRDLFISQEKGMEKAFTPSQRTNHWYANIYEIAKLFLLKEGVTQIWGGNHCTYHENNLFYSYRRDGEKTGRMASVIWFT